MGKPTVSVFRAIRPFIVMGLVFIMLGVAILTLEIQRRTLYVSGYLILMLWVGGIGMIATGATVAWEIQRERK